MLSGYVQQFVNADLHGGHELVWPSRSSATASVPHGTPTKVGVGVGVDVVVQVVPAAQRRVVQRPAGALVGFDGG